MHIINQGEASIWIWDDKIENKKKKKKVGCKILIFKEL
jgi:hypothetical protein